MALQPLERRLGLTAAYGDASALQQPGLPVESGRDHGSIHRG